jgi:hypothetical protein
VTNFFYRRISNFNESDVKFKSFVLMILLLSPILLTGCATLIGFGIGSAIDERKAAYSLLEETDRQRLAPETDLQLTFDDGSRHTGKFAGFSGCNSGGMNDRAGSALPCRGDTIKMIDIYGRARTTRFGALYYKTDNNEHKPYLELDDNSRWVLYNANIYRFMIHSNGDTVAVSDFSSKPWDTTCLAFLLSNNDIISDYPISKIALIEKGKNHKGRTYGLLTGAVLDIVWYRLLFLFGRAMRNG